MVPRRAWLGVLFVWVLLGSAPDPVAGEVVEATLGNGLKVLLLEDHRSPVVSIQTWYRVGSRNERPGLTGLSHLLEQLMFKGTPTYGGRVYARLIEEHGGHHGAFTSPDATVYVVNISAERIGIALDLEADRMRHLTLGAEEVETARRVVLEERRTRSEDDPVGVLREELNAVAFKVHPYRIPPIGFAGDVARIGVRDLRAWYNTYYLPNNAILVVVGDFRAVELLEEVQARFGAIPRGPDPPPVTLVEPRQLGERRVRVRKPAQLPVVAVGYHAPNYESADSIALELLSTILSSGRTSRLYRRLVHGQRLALDAGAVYSRLTVDPDQFTFWVTAMPDQTAEDIERGLMAEVLRLQTEFVSDEELERAKNRIEAEFLFRQDSMHARAATLGRHEVVGGWRLGDEFLPGIRAVTREDLQRVARRYFVGDQRTTAVLIAMPVSPVRSRSASP